MWFEQSAYLEDSRQVRLGVSELRRLLTNLLRQKWHGVVHLLR
jgi:hypothetical protein